MVLDLICDSSGAQHLIERLYACVMRPVCDSVRALVRLAYGGLLFEVYQLSFVL
ncbi:hypothetical protein C8Q80DRAFT_1198723 [Daedaleopsis nitida]|nr:hypothetical protein C8Q80DRAFT_1198723 [Daedaleopsis nitida]